MGLKQYTAIHLGKKYNYFGFSRKSNESATKWYMLLTLQLMAINNELLELVMNLPKETVRKYFSFI
jgi:hypothetical protein